MKTSETAGFTCAKKVGELQKQLSYATLMQKAAKSAAEIQVKAVCRARQSTVAATHAAAVAKRALEDANATDRTPLPGLKTIDLDKCYNSWFSHTDRCDVHTLAQAN